LSRQNLNALQDEPKSDAVTVHSEISLTSTIEATDKPLNGFRNQIVLEEARFPLNRNLVMFRSKTRHFINFTDKGSILKSLKERVNTDGIPMAFFALHTLVSRKLFYCILLSVRFFSIAYPNNLF